MSVIAIDPGYDRIGIAILDKEQGKEKVLFSECFTTDKKKSLSERIFSVTERVRELVALYHPESFAIESLFFSKNTKTALAVAEARGAMINTALSLGLGFYEFMPNEIKLAVTGYGKATKKDIFFMVERLVELSDRKRIDDELDAIAVGLCYYASESFHKRVSL